MTRFTRFFIVGGLCAVLDLGLLYLLTDRFGIWYVYSGIISFLIVSVISFGLHKTISFRDQSRSYRQQYLKFFIVILFGIIINNGLLFIFTNVFGLWYILSRVVSSIIVMFWNYFNNVKRVFV